MLDRYNAQARKNSAYKVNKSTSDSGVNGINNSSSMWSGDQNREEYLENKAQEQANLFV